MRKLKFALLFLAAMVLSIVSAVAVNATGIALYYPYDADVLRLKVEPISGEHFGIDNPQDESLDYIVSKLIPVMQRDREKTTSMINGMTEQSIHKVRTKAVDIEDTVNKKSNSAKLIIQTAGLTVNPVNQERHQIPMISVTFPGNNETVTEDKISDRTKFAILPSTNKANQFVVQPVAAFYDDKNNLVILCVMENRSDQEKVLKGFYTIQFGNNENISARGIPTEFESPIKLSSGTAGNFNVAKLKNGIPNMCFLVISFSPGSYDNSLSLRDWKELSGSYEPITE